MKNFEYSKCSKRFRRAPRAGSLPSSTGLNRSTVAQGAPPSDSSPWPLRPGVSDLSRARARSRLEERRSRYTSCYTLKRGNLMIREIPR